VMGGSGLYRELFDGGGIVDEDGAVVLETALFQMLDGLPLSMLLSVAAIFLIVVVFVTSSDSGSFVVDMIAQGGDPNPPVWSRAFWATVEGVIAAILLLVGGLAALQTMAILVAVPFSIVMVLMVVATSKALIAEHGVMERRRRKWLHEEIAREMEQSGR
ncbi:BCCT family transporter, partial [Nocardioides sp.]|uniref:BCCT family transporter n=1 Tax=Nocardioides sp. TaxID=35761 RepID=UPI002735A9C9